MVCAGDTSELCGSPTGSRVYAANAQASSSLPVAAGSATIPAGTEMSQSMMSTEMSESMMMSSSVDAGSSASLPIAGMITSSTETLSSFTNSVSDSAEIFI